MKAAKGCGKTALLAWLAWNFLLTRPHPKIAATSISADNLADGLWTELALWQSKSELLKQTFTWTKTRIFANDHPETWWLAARSYSKSADPARQADTLAGLHANYILFLLDESGGMSDAVMAAAEAALATGTECHIVQAGNPTNLEGPLYRACTSEKRLWYVKEITGDPDDPNRSSRISIQWAREQIEKWGRDNPYTLVNVFGKFPPSSMNSLIGPDEVAESMRRVYNEYQIGQAPLVFGVDVARFGDDSSKIMPRRGIQMFKPRTLRNVDSTQGAGTVSRMWQDMGADAVFIDDTGGFGSGWIDQLRLLGRAPIGIHFAGQAHDKNKFVNKRAEMAFDLVEWIKRGGALPDIPELAAALTQTTYTFSGDRLLLEPKEAVKIKLGYSPDDFDAAILTMAEPVASTQVVIGRSRNQASATYNPFAELDKAVQQSYRDPYREG